MDITSMINRLLEIVPDMKAGELVYIFGISEEEAEELIANA